MHVLSVDWDFFFCDTAQFDWGHRESTFFAEAIWGLRAGMRSLFTGESAIEIMQPDKGRLRGFWKRFAHWLPPRLLIVCESHLSLLEFLRANNLANSTIWNFDAHHDLGYEMQEDNCGNWALKAFEEGLLSDYRLVYPEWRKALPERKEGVPVPTGLKVDVMYKIPRIEFFDFVFICRSGSWTPTWSDAAWQRFIRYFKTNHPMTWLDKTFAPFALKSRSPNMAEAKKLAADHAACLTRLGVVPLQAPTA